MRHPRPHSKTSGRHPAASHGFSCVHTPVNKTTAGHKSEKLPRHSVSDVHYHDDYRDEGTRGLVHRRHVLNSTSVSHTRTCMNPHAPRKQECLHGVLETWYAELWCMPTFQLRSVTSNKAKMSGTLDVVSCEESSRNWKDVDCGCSLPGTLQHLSWLGLPMPLRL
ncbi:hypothetical protein SRHO_G00309340 [Serrasalmus rhombeus]